MFRMPSYRELSPDQEAVFDLPVEGRYLVVGSPGTGKTVMALMRAQMLRDLAADSPATFAAPTFLVYNQVLRQFLTQSISRHAIDGLAQTYHRFFFDWFPSFFGIEVPHEPGNPYEFRWQAMREIARAHTGFGTEAPIQHLIVDEGQDFPPAFYEFISLIAANITVFADDNQTIREAAKSSSIDQIKSKIDFDASRDLTTNFRNTRQIADVAASFYAGTPSQRPTPPTRNGPSPKLIRYPSLQAQADAIALYERARPRSFIGVIAERHAVLESIHAQLQGQTINPIRYFNPQAGQRFINFAQPGIFLLTYLSVKGLEFDVVFLPGVDVWRNRNQEVAQHLMAAFVQTSRPRHDLRVLHTEPPPPIFDYVPASLLNRHESTLYDRG